MGRRSRFLLFVLLLAVAAGVWFSPLRDHLTRDEIRATIESVRALWYAPLLLVAMYALGCVFAVPASLFIIVAGAVWGWALGGTISMIGGMLGAMGSYWAGRLIGGTWADANGRTARAAARYLRDPSMRSLLIVRLLPILPFAALNYGAGILRVNASSFFVSTLLGLIPSNYVFAWSADEIFNGSLNGGAVLARLFAVAAVCVLIVAIPSFAARVVQRGGTDG